MATPAGVSLFLVWYIAQRCSDTTFGEEENDDNDDDDDEEEEDEDDELSL